jgi:hypothetical protein
MKTTYFWNGFHYYNLYPKFQNNVPERLYEVNSFFEAQADTVRMAKKSFREQIATKALTLSPKDAFDLRLKCLDFLIPHFGPHEHCTLIEPNVYEYYVSSEGMFRLEDEDDYETFLKDDDRYHVELDEVECTDHDSWGFAVRLTILNAADDCGDVDDEDEDDKEDENSDDDVVYDGENADGDNNDNFDDEDE